MPEELKNQAKKIIKKCEPNINKIKSLRAAAFIIFGLHQSLISSSSKKNLFLLKKFSEILIESYHSNSSPEWQWFENHLTYSNSKLPEALFLAYEISEEKLFLDVAEKTLAFLSCITFEKNHYAPIGQNGWYFRNKKRAYFDQQPEDASSMTETKITAHRITKNQKHLEDAFKSLKWFLGENHLNQMVYNENTGGCHDGLGEHGLNLNQGAESTISYLMARLAFEIPETKNQFISQ